MTTKTLVNILAASVGILFLGGMFEWEIGEGFTMFVGLIMCVVVAWLTLKVNSDKF